MYFAYDLQEVPNHPIFKEPLLLSRKYQSGTSGS